MGSGEGTMLKTVAEYRELAAECRKLAAKLSNPEDRRALESIASAWDTVANEREARGEK
jgi:hypothetical protein